MTGKEAAGIVNNVITSLKGQPMIIGLLVLVISMQGLVVFGDLKRQEANAVEDQIRKELILNLMAQCGPKQ